MRTRMYIESGSLKPVPPFDFDQALRFIGGFMPTRSEQTISKGTLTKAVYVNGQLIAFKVESAGTIEKPALSYTLYSEKPITEAQKNAAEDRISFYLSIED